MTEAFPIKASGKTGDAEIVSPEDDHHVCGNGIVPQLEILPYDAGGTQCGLVHLAIVAGWRMGID